MGLEDIEKNVNDLLSKSQSYSKLTDKKQKEQLKKDMKDISSRIKELVRKQAELVKDV